MASGGSVYTTEEVLEMMEADDEAVRDEPVCGDSDSDLGSDNEDEARYVEFIEECN